MGSPFHRLMRFSSEFACLPLGHDPQEDGSRRHFQPRPECPRSLSLRAAGFTLGGVLRLMVLMSRSSQSSNWRSRAMQNQSG